MHQHNAGQIPSTFSNFNLVTKLHAKGAVIQSANVITLKKKKSKMYLLNHTKKLRK